MWTDQMKEWVAKIRKHALTNYEKDGWDYLVETYSDTDIAFEIKSCKTYEAALARIGQLMALLDDHRKEIKSTEF